MKKSERLLRSVYERPRLSLALNVFSFSVSALAAAAFCAALVLLFVRGEYFDFAKLAVSAGVPFFGVGLARRLINAKRPYEVYDFYKTCPKRSPFSRKKDEKLDTGASFPSRHAYSAFVIATLLFFYFPAAGAVLLVLGALMCTARVLLGIHFWRDVITGAVIGVVAGMLGEIFFGI